MENFCNSSILRDMNFGGKQLVVTPVSRLTDNHPGGVTNQRTNLPIYKYKHVILEHINNESVTIIAGETGCGKTSQVPLYILERALETAIPCHIVSIQPSSLAALSTLNRVSTEQGGKFNELMALQTEANMCSNNQNFKITFCSKQVFLQSLMKNINYLQSFTHLIIDQAHERDRFSDILMATVLIHKQGPNLSILNPKLILLSANINTNRLAEYFQITNIIQIQNQPSAPFTEYFLEDLLMSTDFMKKSHGRNNTSIYDQLISQAWFNGSENAFADFMNLVTSEKLPVNYQHSQTGVSMLMAAAFHGKLDFVKNIISSGGDPTLKVQGMIPFDMADDFNHHTVTYFLSSCSPTPSIKKYLSTTKDLNHFYSKQARRTNLDVIMSILWQYISKCSVSGSVLVFLPGYTEVVELCEMISNSLLRHELEVHALHSYLCIESYNKVFSPSPRYRRKVILCTSFAETSMTFDDVYCVIDSGIVRDKEGDVVYTNQRKSESISKSSMLERAKHVKSGGVVFRLYSRRRVEGFLAYDIPEINRISLVDSTLFSFRLKPEKIRLQLFFCFFPDGGPPSPLIREAIQALRELGAIDSKDKVTPIGVRLSNFPIEPNLVKMIILGITFKCLDPVLTIACCLARDSPFLEETYTSSSQNVHQSQTRHQSALLLDNINNTNKTSDHWALLKAYLLWHNATDKTAKAKVCQQHSLSLTSMELIHLLRTQLVHHLKMNGFLKWDETSLVEKFNINSGDWTSVQSVLTAALYPSIARYNPANGSLVTASLCDGESLFHHTSVLVKLGKDCNALSTNLNHQLVLQDGQRSEMKSCYVVYEKTQKAGSFTILHTCSVVPSKTVMLFAGNPSIEPLSPDREMPAKDTLRNCRLCTELNFEMLGLDGFCHLHLDTDLKIDVKLEINDFIHFVMDAYSAHLILTVRRKWQDLLSECVSQPGKASSAIEENWIRSLIRHVSSEECTLIREPWSRQLSKLNLNNNTGGNDALMSSFQKMNCVDIKQLSRPYIHGDCAPCDHRVTEVVQNNQYFDG